MQYDNTNTGVLFKNVKKEKESQPDYRGELNVDGKQKEIAAWIKMSRTGTKFLSIKVSELYKMTERPRQEQRVNIDDVPFWVSDVIDAKDYF